MVQDAFINKNTLKIGDVFICYNSKRYSVTRYFIHRYTESNYTHAGIYIGNYKVLEAVGASVRVIDLDIFLAEYNHAAVLRNKTGWGVNTRRNLLKLTNYMLGKDVRYNFGVLFFLKNRKNHVNYSHDRLKKVFEGKMTLKSHIKNRYFCSELIVTCFIKVGILSQKFEIVLQPNAMAPIDLAKNSNIFGYLEGYISTNHNCIIPDTEEFKSGKILI